MSTSLTITRKLTMEDEEILWIYQDG